MRKILPPLMLIIILSLTTYAAYLAVKLADQDIILQHIKEMGNDTETN